MKGRVFATGTNAPLVVGKRSAGEMGADEGNEKRVKVGGPE